MKLSDEVRQLSGLFEPYSDPETRCLSYADRIATLEADLAATKQALTDTELCCRSREAMIEKIEADRDRLLKGINAV